MKIAFVLYDDIFGGIASHTIQYVTGMSKRGVLTYLIAPPPSPNRTNTISKQLSVDVPLLRFDLRGEQPCHTLWEQIYAFIRWLRQEKIDIVHILRPNANQTKWVIIATKLAYIPHLITTTSDQTPCLPRLNRFFTYLLNSLVDKSIVVSQVCLDQQLVDRLIPSSKLVLVPNGVKLNVSVSRSHSSFSTHLRIGTIARLEETKGIDTLLQAFAKINQLDGRVQLAIIGDGSQYTYLHQLAQNLGIINHIQFYGCVSDSQKDMLMSNFDIFALPTRWEGFGLAIAEAMSVGCPVVVTKVGGVTDFVTHEQTGLLSPVDDVDRFAQNLQRLIDDPILRTTIGHRGKLLIEQQFSEELMINRTLQLYQSVLKS